MDLTLLRNLPRAAQRARYWLGLISMLIGLFLWWAAARYSGLPAFILPSPAEVWQRFLRALVRGELVRHTSVTLFEVLLGLGIGVSFAILLGYMLAKSRALEQVLSPPSITSWKSTVRSVRIRVCHEGESRFQIWVGLQDIAPRIAQLEIMSSVMACE